MTNRLELHDRLINVIGNNNVYYQPPESYKIKYPGIIYNIGVGKYSKANNKIYSYKSKYEITCIINNEDDGIIMKMLNSFEYCSFDRAFVNDNLYHYVFNLYY